MDEQPSKANSVSQSTSEPSYTSLVPTASQLLMMPSQTLYMALEKRDTS